MKYSELNKYLRSRGWQCKRKSIGSHEIWYFPANGETLLVTRYSRDLDRSAKVKKMKEIQQKENANENNKTND